MNRSSMVYNESMNETNQTKTIRTFVEFDSSNHRIFVIEFDNESIGFEDFNDFIDEFMFIRENDSWLDD